MFETFANRRRPLGQASSFSSPSAIMATASPTGEYIVSELSVESLYVLMLSVQVGQHRIRKHGRWTWVAVEAIARKRVLRPS